MTTSTNVIPTFDRHDSANLKAIQERMAPNNRKIARIEERKAKSNAQWDSEIEDLHRQNNLFQDILEELLAKKEAFDAYEQGLEAEALGDTDSSEGGEEAAVEEIPAESTDNYAPIVEEGLEEAGIQEGPGNIPTYEDEQEPAQSTDAFEGNPFA